KTIGIARGPARLDLHVAPDGPARLLQALQKGSVTRVCPSIVRGKGIQHADPSHARLLRARRERPCGSRAAEDCDELAAFHSSVSVLRSKDSILQYGGRLLRCGISSRAYDITLTFGPLGVRLLGLAPMPRTRELMRACVSLGNEPDVTSSRVCLPPSSL